MARLPGFRPGICYRLPDLIIHDRKRYTDGRALLAAARLEERTDATFRALWIKVEGCYQRARHPVSRVRLSAMLRFLPEHV